MASVSRYLDCFRYNTVADVYANLTGSTFKILLVGSSYTFSATSHTWLSDVTGEVSGTNYTAGGKTITPTITRSSGSNIYTVSWPETSWAASEITAARGAIIYRNTGTAGTSPLALFSNFDGPVSSIPSGDPFKVLAMTQIWGQL